MGLFSFANASGGQFVESTETYRPHDRGPGRVNENIELPLSEPLQGTLRKITERLAG